MLAPRCEFKPMRPLRVLAAVVVGLVACDQQQDLGRSAGPSCERGYTACSAACVNTFSHPLHCGGCGLACPTGMRCQRGACVDRCSEPYSACDRSCVTIYEDDQHCGACNKICGEGEHCDNGVCNACATGKSFCYLPATHSFRCMNLKSDPLNCGSCGKSCTRGQPCENGLCR